MRVLIKHISSLYLIRYGKLLSCSYSSDNGYFFFEFLYEYNEKQIWNFHTILN